MLASSYAMNMEEAERALVEAVKARCYELATEAKNGDVISGLALCRFYKCVDYYNKSTDSKMFLHIKRPELVIKLSSKNLIYMVNDAQIGPKAFKTAGYVPERICKVMRDVQNSANSDNEMFKSFDFLSNETQTFIEQNEKQDEIQKKLSESLLNHDALSLKGLSSGEDSDDEKY